VDVKEKVMYDIEDSIANAQLQDNDPQGYIGALDRWSPRAASRIAEERELPSPMSTGRSSSACANLIGCSARLGQRAR
jgi:hypothetical protein